MNRIELHIENLLLSHDCVIVPGIGGFVTRFEESFISEDGFEIYPPYRSVSFNSNLRVNDGLLTQSYMSAYDTNFPKAQLMVEEDARMIRERLQSDGEYQFGSIGKLQFTQSRALIFTPSDNNGIVARELYGLIQCSLPVMLTTKEIEQPTNTIEIMKEAETDNKAMASAPDMKVVEPEATTQDTNTETKNKENKHYVIRLSKNSVHYAVAAVAAIILYFVFSIAPSIDITNNGNILEASIFGTPAKTEKPKTSPNNAANEKQQVAATSKDSVDNTIIKVEDSIANEIAPAENAAATETVNNNPAITEQHSPVAETATGAETYTIVLASAVSLKGATNFVNNLHKSGLWQAHIYTKNNMTRVTYGTFTSQADAYKALAELKPEHSCFSSAWVMKD